MKTQRMLLPRKLEEEGTAGKIAEVLDRHRARPWPGAEAEVPVLKLSPALERAIRKARLQRRVRPGFEDIANKLDAEKKGLDEARRKTATVQKERISRLLLFSNDAAERLYRHIGQLIERHHPRILGCLLDIDGRSLGYLIAGEKGMRGSGVKVILIGHKDAAADVLRTLMDDNQANGF
jgi:hypothetical protein